MSETSKVPSKSNFGGKSTQMRELDGLTGRDKWWHDPASVALCLLFPFLEQCSVHHSNDLFQFPNCGTICAANKLSATQWVAL